MPVSRHFGKQHGPTVIPGPVDSISDFLCPLFVGRREIDECDRAVIYHVQSVEIGYIAEDQGLGIAVDTRLAMIGDHYKIHFLCNG